MCAHYNIKFGNGVLDRTMKMKISFCKSWLRFLAGRGSKMQKAEQLSQSGLAMLLRRSCTNHEPVNDVQAHHAQVSFVKGTFHHIS